MAHRMCRLLTRTCLDTVSRCRVPRMLTPLASSAGGAFTIECPAIDVLCHPKGTVGETSGFHHRLARPGQSPALADDCWPQACINPCCQNRAGTERFRNSAAHDSERLQSYQRTHEFYPVSRCHLPGCPREASNTAYPFARHLPRFRVFSPRPPVKGCLGSCRARSRFHRACLSAPHGRDQRYVRPTSAISHFKDEHPNFARLSTR